MGRWSQYDEDDYRLPEGMQRVGYDADTQTYTYQARDGSSWEGAPGAKYGALRQVGAASEPSRASRAEELEQLPEAASATNNKETDIPSPTEKHHEKPGEDILSDMPPWAAPSRKTGASSRPSSSYGGHSPRAGPSAGPSLGAVARVRAARGHIYSSERGHLRGHRAGKPFERGGAEGDE